MTKQPRASRGPASHVLLVLKYLVVFDLSLAVGCQFDFLVKRLVTCSTLVWLLVAISTFSIIFGRLFNLCLAVSHQFVFSNSLVVCSALVWLFSLFSCLVLYCSTLFLTLVIIRLLVFYYSIFFSQTQPLCLAMYVFAPKTFLRSPYSFIWCLP